jgi:uncharacterized membrane protein YhhN
MNWPFLAVVFSGWLYIDAIYRGPAWQKWLFKPITLGLLLLWAWQAPKLAMYDYLILCGLALSLVGDALFALSKERLLPVIGAYFACYLLYTIRFAVPLNFSFHAALFVGVLIVFIAVIALIWSALEEMRWPVLIYFALASLMVWIGGERYLAQSDGASLSMVIGSLLLWISSALWLLNLYRFSLKAGEGVIASCYFLGHFMIVRALHMVSSVEISVPTV